MYAFFSLKVLCAKPFPIGDLIICDFFLTKCHQDLKKKEENQNDYLYVSANIEGKTIVIIWGMNSQNYYRQ